MAKPISALDLFRAGNDTMQIAARLSVSEEEALEQVPASAALLFVFRLLTRSIPTPSPPAGRKGRSHTRGGISSFLCAAPLRWVQPIGGGEHGKSRNSTSGVSKSRGEANVSGRRL